MPYCTNCGTNYIQEAKFCTSCGAKINGETSNEYPSEYKEKLYKNTVTGLEQSQNVSEVFKPNKKAESYLEETSSKTGGITIWTWIYLIINALLVYLGYRIETVLGTLLFSVVVLLLVFLRRDKPKPYNWLVKIILLLQLVYLILVLPEGILYLGINTLLLIALFITNFILLFKGNKK